MTTLFRLACLLFFLYLFSPATVNAQRTPSKWGKVSAEEKALKEVPYDKQAHAVVIAETGILQYAGNDFAIQRHSRIKILDKEGIEEANITIPYYKKGRFQRISSVKAQTLEIQENGKVIKHKLSKSEIFDVETDDSWGEIRFALPAVKAGSIIEYSYTFHTSNFTFLEGWVFQNSIPTLYSSFKVEIPTFLTYSTLLQGSRLYQKYADRDPTNTWVLENLPALKSEPFTYNLIDYAEKIQFQLQSYQTSSGAHKTASEKSVFTDWQATGNEVLSSVKSRQYLNNNRLPEELTQKFARANSNTLQQAKEIYAFVQQHFEWSTAHGILPDKTLKNLLRDKKGNGTAINLLLTSLLKEAGFNAEPALISTKMHGKVSPKYTMLSQFNHMICRLQLEGSQYLLDAAGKQVPFGILPIKDLNQHALVLTEEVSWMEISDDSKSSTVLLCSSDLRNGLHQFSCKWQGYEALEIAAALEAERLPQLFNSSGTLLPDSTRINNQFAEQNTLEASFVFKEEHNKDHERIYYQLPVPESFQSNPFKTEERHLPVDFGYSFNRQLIYNIELPEGYTLEEKPESVLLRTPDGKAVFTFQAALMGNTLHVQIGLSIKNNLIPATQYLNLRELYSKMIMHCEQPLVLLRAADVE
jgi:hypothetical protein